MEESVNYAEYTVTKKAEGKALRKRILLIVLYLVVIAAFVVAVVLTSGAAAIWATVVVPLFIALVFFTQRLVKEERKYEISNAKLVISELNAGGKGKVVSDDLVSAYSVIAPATEENREKWTSADEIKDFRGDTKSPDSYFARLEKDGKSVVVLFEATNKMLKSMKFYNRNTEVVTVRH